DAVEGLADGGERVQRLVERHVLEVDADRLVAELGVEDEVHPHGLAEGLVGLAEAGAAEAQAERLQGPGTEHEAGERLLARAILHLLDRQARRALAPRLRLLHLAYEVGG